MELSKNESPESSNKYYTPKGCSSQSFFSATESLPSSQSTAQTLMMEDFETQEVKNYLNLILAAKIIKSDY